MSQRPKRNLRKRLSKDADESTTKTFPNHPLAAASANDRKEWKGFCEIESEPVRTLCDAMMETGSLTVLEAYFNAMLREFGVTGLKVQEVVSLDEQFLAYHA